MSETPSLTSNNSNTFLLQQNAAFENLETPVLSNVWVAIGTNIATEFYKWNSRLSTSSWAQIVYDEILSLQDLMENNPQVQQSIVGANMQIIQEYYSFLENNFGERIQATENREAFLNNAINQLAFRYKNAENSIQTLNSQKQFLETTIQNAENDIDTIKTQLSMDYAAFDTEWVLTDMNDYIEKKNLVTTANMYLVFSNKFIDQYEFLNNYNKRLLDTLILNRKVILSDSFVVIPDTWDTTLRDLELLFDEAEFKTQSWAEIYTPDLNIVPNSSLNSVFDRPMNNQNAWGIQFYGR